MARLLKCRLRLVRLNLRGMSPRSIKGAMQKGVFGLAIIDGNICAVKGNRIVLIDSETGKKELASCSIGANIGYFCRPAYKDGLSGCSF